jgi:flagellar motor switch protein FliM
LSVLSQENLEATVKVSQHKRTQCADKQPRSVQTYNFRSAGRMSNENARALTAIHETFARHLAVTLNDYLGAELEVKLRGLEQLPMQEYVASIPPLSYIVPFVLRSVPCTVFVECDLNVAFPIIERLLGGMGGPVDGMRELSELEEEIMQDVTSLISRKAEQAWHIPNMSLEQGRRIKSSLMGQNCSPAEKVSILKFTIEIAGTAGSLQLVLSASFANLLIDKIRGDRPAAKSRLRYFPMPSIRERILDCDVVVAAGLFPLRVPVRDLVGLQAGSVLKLRAPVGAPAALSLEGRELFEALPVRNGLQKAAQLVRRAQRASWEGE